MLPFFIIFVELIVQMLNFVFDKLYQFGIFVGKFLHLRCYFQKIESLNRFCLILFFASLTFSLLTVKLVRHLSYLYEDPLPCVGGNQQIPQNSRSRLAIILRDGKIIPHSPEWAVFFNFFSKITYQQGALRSGEYYFPPSSSFKDILKILRFSPSVLHFLSIPEGLTAIQIKDALNHAPGLKGKEVSFDEGYAFPDTYAFSLNSNRDDLLSRMHTSAERHLAKAWEERDIKTLNGLVDDPFTLLILASLIEKETSIDSERPKIARVFLNRISKNMPLQTDPTIFYALALKGEDVPNKRLTFDHLKIESPYNTYRNKGLPPGPICSPGMSSLEAAAHPADGDDLYFVANGKGGHVFSTTFAQHRQNIQQWHEAINNKKTNDQKSLSKDIRKKLP
ncbi:endolytic transglycosylase MltG [Acetobacteraceae bacterium]|nr:endolytic transglycosylase MltG [Acetobacteraceae bacterium]